MNNPRRSVESMVSEVSRKVRLYNSFNDLEEFLLDILTAERTYYEGEMKEFETLKELYKERCDNANLAWDEVAKLRALCGEMVEILDKINIGGIRRVRYQTIEQVLAKAKKEMGE